MITDTHPRQSRRRYMNNPFIQSSEKDDVFKSIEQLYKDIERNVKNTGFKEGNQTHARIRGTKKLVERLYESEKLSDHELDEDGNCKHTLDWTAYVPVQILYFEYLSRKYNLSCNMNLNRMHKSPIRYAFELFGLVINVYNDEKKYNPNILKDQLKNKRLAEEFSKCIGNETSDSMNVYPYYVRVGFYNNEGKPTGGHANLLLIRPNLGLIEYFEPHGIHFQSNNYKKNKTQIKQITNAVRNFAEQFNLHGSSIGRKPYTLILPHLTCPQLEGKSSGVQSIESSASHKTCHEKNRGYCAAWSFFVLELVLMNPKRTLRDTQESVLDYIQTKYTNEKDFYQSYQTIDVILRTIIRSYIRHIYKSLTTFVNMIYDKSFTTDKEVSDFLTKSHNENFSKFLDNYTLYLKLLKFIDNESIQSPNELQQKVDELQYEKGPTIINDLISSEEEIERNKMIIDNIVQKMKNNELLWLPKSKLDNSNKRKGKSAEENSFFNSFDIAINNTGKQPVPLLPNHKMVNNVDILREELEITENLLEEERDESDKLKDIIKKKDKEITDLKKDNLKLINHIGNLKRENKTMKLKLKEKIIKLQLRPNTRSMTKRKTLKATH